MVRGRGVEQGDQCKDEDDAHTQGAKEEVNEYSGRPRRNRSQRRIQKYQGVNKRMRRRSTRRQRSLRLKSKGGGQGEGGDK